MRILVSGGGIGGLALALRLRGHGFHPVVVEKARSFGRVGYPMTMLGESIELLRGMGLLEGLERKSAKHVPRTYVDRAGRVLRKFDTSRYTELSSGGLVLNRADLHLAIHDAAREIVDIRMGRSITKVVQSPDGVEATFDDGSEEGFDVLVGADGVHSRTRRLVFGEGFEEYFGVAYMAFLVPTGEVAGVSRLDFNLLLPGRMASVSPYGPDEVGGFYLFHSEPGGPKPSGEARRRMLISEFGDALPFVTEVVEAIPDPASLFHDDMTQIVMPRWSEGRVALLGDAAYSLSLMSGQGASMAIIGSHVLAEEISRAKDHREAFAGYESRMRAAIEPLQRQAYRRTRTFVPTRRFHVNLFNLFMRHAPESLVERMYAGSAAKQTDFDPIWESGADMDYGR